MAARSFEKLDKEIRRQVKNKLKELEEYPEQRGKHLKYINTTIFEMVNICDIGDMSVRIDEHFDGSMELVAVCSDDATEDNVRSDISRYITKIAVDDDILYRYDNSIWDDNIDYSDVEDAWERCPVLRLCMLMDIYGGDVCSMRELVNHGEKQQ